jgi:hypothetical protein
MCTLDEATDVNPVIKFLRHALQRVSQEFMNNPVFTYLFIKVISEFSQIIWSYILSTSASF